MEICASKKEKKKTEIFLTAICRRTPDHLIELVGYGHYEYEWDYRVFLERTRWGYSKKLAYQIGAEGASVGLRIAASCIVRPAVIWLRWVSSWDKDHGLMSRKCSKNSIYIVIYKCIV